MNNNIKDNFWFNDYKVLYKQNRIIEFFPAKFMNQEEKLNAIVRFSFFSVDKMS